MRALQGVCAREARQCALSMSDGAIVVQRCKELLSCYPAASNQAESLDAEYFGAKRRLLQQVLDVAYGQAERITLSNLQ